MEGLNRHILSTIKTQDDKTKIGLLSLLSPDGDEEAIGVMRELADPKNQALTKAVVTAATLISHGAVTEFLKEIFESYEDPEVKAHAVVGLYRHDPTPYKPIIDQWLSSEESHERRAGVIASGGTGDQGYIHVLTEMLENEQGESTIAMIFVALHQLEANRINDLTLPFLDHASKLVRRSALDALDIADDRDMRGVIRLLGDPSPDIQELARKKLQEASYQNAQLLIESLAVPNRKLREGIFSLLESLEIKDVDVFHFARSQMERAYRNLTESEVLRSLEDEQYRSLLIEHLQQKKDVRIETVLRVLVTQDRSGQFRIIWRGLYSHDSRQRSNAIEALEDNMGHALSQYMIPLLEGLDPSECVAIGKKAFEIPQFDSDLKKIYEHLLSKYDWVTVVLTLKQMEKEGMDGLDKGMVEPCLASENPHIREMARRILDGKRSPFPHEEKRMEESISVPDKILHLRGIQIFEGLSVSELAAIASVTEEAVYDKGSTIIKEGEPGETMYMMVSGEVSVLKAQDGGHEIELDRMGSGDYFGEMALFEDQVRSATIRAEEETRLLVLHKREFGEIVREYPQIALHICKELSNRLRKLHAMVQGMDKDMGEVQE
jgi:hypothetical protein